MKNVLIALLLLFTTASCLPKKKTDPEPELAGTYQISQLISGNQTFNLPSGGESASVLVTRPSDTQITFRLDTNDNGQVTTGTATPATIAKASGSGYDVMVNGRRIGSIDGTNFSLDFTSNGQRFAITARK